MSTLTSPLNSYLSLTVYMPYVKKIMEVQIKYKRGTWPISEKNMQWRAQYDVRTCDVIYSERRRQTWLQATLSTKSHIVAPMNQLLTVIAWKINANA